MRSGPRPRIDAVISRVLVTDPYAGKCGETWEVGHSRDRG